MLILTAFSTTRPIRGLRTALIATLAALGQSRSAGACGPLPRYFSATSLALLCCLPGVLHAEGAQRGSWTVGAGSTTVLAEYYEIQGSDCRALRAPPVVIKTRPTQGKLVINTTTGQADKPAKCRNVEVPVTRVLYHAGPQLGSETVGWEIFFQSRELGTRSVQGTVTVTARQPSRR
ncbi:hypothetical protein CAL12_17270 [Bordetella genomosp. 8]|uniref:Uncharacterized protein n=1 Tax=Bordetella genomosp. 8 TaxID=1416806 RepID=A0A1W6YMW0_9BORD|nr:hypothetical protein CAL12_17270 [Bordetella genomosp. 8]